MERPGAETLAHRSLPTRMTSGRPRALSAGLRADLTAVVSARRSRAPLRLLARLRPCWPARSACARAQRARAAPAKLRLTSLLTRLRRLAAMAFPRPAVY